MTSISEQNQIAQAKSKGKSKKRSNVEGNRDYPASASPEADTKHKTQNNGPRDCESDIILGEPQTISSPKSCSSCSDSGQEQDHDHEESSGTSSSSAIDEDEDEVEVEESPQLSSCGDERIKLEPDNDSEKADCFEDASEYLQPQAQAQAQPQATSTTPDDAGQIQRDPTKFDLEAQLEETRHVLELALNNQFTRALEICGPRANDELYSGLAYATLCFLRASLTMEPSDLEAAVNGINKTFEVASRARRKTSVIARFLYKPNYDQFTDEQIHAELVEAESLLLLSLISFLSDQSVICLVRSAIRIRACYQRYKECLTIMRSRTNWSSELARRHFESGVRMGHGTFNLLMSYLPRRVLRILEYVGFSGNRSIGIDELDQSIELEDGLRSTLSALITLVYHSYIENIFGLGNYEPAKVEQVSELLLRQHPESAFFLLFRGRYHQMLGRLDEAIDTFQRSIDAQDDWVQFHSICHWEMMWCHAARMDWPRAAHYADLLRKRSKWSPASYTYQYATFLYAQLVEDQRGCSGSDSAVNAAQFEQRLEQIVQLMHSVPSLRVRIAGKTVPAEKFAIVRSAKFLELGNRLTLPALEFLYIWNIFVYLRNCPRELQKLLARIESELSYVGRDSNSGDRNLRELELESDDENADANSASSSGVHSRSRSRSSSSESNPPPEPRQATWRNDDYYVILLLKGMCLKQLGRFEQADSVLSELVGASAKISEDTFIAPHAGMELALLKLLRRQFEEAKQIVRTVRNEHTGYLHETMVHFKLHAASRLIRLEQQSTSPTTTTTTSSSCSSSSATQCDSKERAREVNKS